MQTLVIGFGNRLRSDDGIGPAVAETVASWMLPDVRALALHQLTPELVADLQDADRVLFIDASAAPLAAPFIARMIEPLQSSHVLGHHADAAHLLALTRELSGRCPQAWLLAFGVESLDFGETLSASAQANMQAALPWVRAWLRLDVS